MALRVWLPLNGTLENKGLSTIIPSGTPTFLDNGKIGKCISLNPRISFTNLPKMEKFTILFWLKVDSCAADWADSLSFRSYTQEDAQGSDFRFEATKTSRACSFHNNTSYTITQGSRVLITNSQYEEWHHCGFSYDGENCYTYIDGVLTYTDTGLGGYIYNYFHIGETNNMVGGMNDLRIYDECLSDNQIKEIAKGLIVHYKLEPESWNPNLAVPNPMVNGGATSFTFDPKQNMYTIISPAGDSTWGYGLVIGATKSKCIVPYNSFYRFSFEVFVPSEHVLVVDYNNYSNDTSQWNPSGNDNDLTSVRLTNTKTIPANTWTKCIFGSKNANTSNTTQTDLYENSKIGIRTVDDTESVTWYLKNFKFELGDTVTDYVDFGYNPMDFIITDVSGNGYDSIKNGTFNYNIETPRYTKSTIFNTNTSYIKLPALNTSGFENSFSIVWWSKITDMNGKMAWGFGDGNRLNIYPSGGYFCCNTGDGSNNPYKNNGTAVAFSSYNNNWHQYVMVGDGSTNKLYIDGVYVGTATTYKGITGSQIYISGWGTDTNYKWVNGSISDFRIYTTALSADEILKMYKNSGIIDNKNNVYAYEFKEE